VGTEQSSAKVYAVLLKIAPALAEPEFLSSTACGGGGREALGGGTKVKPRKGRSYHALSSSDLSFDRFSMMRVRTVFLLAIL